MDVIFDCEAAHRHGLTDSSGKFSSVPFRSFPGQ